MKNFILPVVFVLVSIALFVVYINPAYSEIKTLQTEREEFDEALNKSKELQAIRDQLLTRYNTFPPEDLERLQKLLPDNVDNVRLILDLDEIASSYGLRVQNVAVREGSEQSEENTSRPTIGKNNGSVSSVLLTFSVNATYSNFVAFLKDLEQSLRIVDVESLSFSSSENDLYEYTMSVRTYWLK
ncbi:MAG: type 4a pilus biogenesis protein PilO [Candidatus Paceibacterota bacterium]